MKNYKIHEIRGYIQSIYMVEEGNDLFLLDGCSKPDVEVVKSFIETELNKNISDLKLVISTHAHPDHMGGLFLFKKYNIKIAGPKEINDWYKGVNGIFTYLVDILLLYLVAFNKKRGLKNVFFPRSIDLDFVLDDGDKVPGFEDWSSISCPGHTGMDLTIYHREDKVAYVADNLVGSSKNVFKPYPISFPKKYKNSLKRYIDLGIEDFLLAHYGRVSVKHKRLLELIESVGDKPRRHRNSLHTILLKLGRSLIEKVLQKN